MCTIDRKEIASNLFDFIFFVHHRLINPTEQLKKVPIPPSHIKLMFFLNHFGDTSITEAANQLNISKPNMTPIIDKLIAENYVLRFNDETDRRIIRISLTEHGKEFLCEQIRLAKERLLDKISNLTDADFYELNIHMTKMREIIKSM